MKRGNKPTHRPSFWGLLLWTARHWWLLAAVAVIILALWAYRQCSTGKTTIAIEHNRAIDTTPEEIRALRDIKQWETLSINCEELVDTFDTDWKGNRQLVRIYTGTVRLGVDLTDAAPDWFTTHGDTAILKLPDIKLLDEKFIDEARTRSFYERGNWDAHTRQQLYDRARRAMLRRSLTPDNLELAQQNANEQFTSLMKGLGYRTVIVTFENS